MGERTGIAWAHGTFNPWWGCTRATKACQNCYAEAWAKRCGFDAWGRDAKRVFFGDKHWAQPMKRNRKAEKEGERRRIFAGSMCDVFEDRDDLFAPRTRLFHLVEDTPWLTWMFCTKRPENYHRLLPASWLLAPRPNVWLLATASEQNEFDTAANELIRLPAVVRGISVEPMLGPILQAASWMQRGRVRHGCPAHAHRFHLECVDCLRQPGWWSAARAAQAPARWSRAGSAAFATSAPTRERRSFSSNGASGSQTTKTPANPGAGLANPGGPGPHRLGKKVTGNVPDGRTWEQFPEGDAA